MWGFKSPLAHPKTPAQQGFSCLRNRPLLPVFYRSEVLGRGPSRDKLTGPLLELDGSRGDIASDSATEPGPFEGPALLIFVAVMLSALLTHLHAKAAAGLVVEEAIETLWLVYKFRWRLVNTFPEAALAKEIALFGIGPLVTGTLMSARRSSGRAQSH